MPFSFLIASALLTVPILQAAEIKPPAPDPLKICLTGNANLWVVAQAQDLASRIFSDIGIQLEWYHDDRHCKTPSREFLIVLLNSYPPRNLDPGALA